MTISPAKMRVPLQRVAKKTGRAIRMNKPVATKKKRFPTTKSNLNAAETISFVIKGQLTPIKTAAKSAKAPLKAAKDRKKVTKIAPEPAITPKHTKKQAETRKKVAKKVAAVKKIARKNTQANAKSNVGKSFLVGQLAAKLVKKKVMESAAKKQGKVVAAAANQTPPPKKRCCKNAAPIAATDKKTEAAKKPEETTMKTKRTIGRPRLAKPKTKIKKEEKAKVVPRKKATVKEEPRELRTKPKIESASESSDDDDAPKPKKKPSAKAEVRKTAAASRKTAVAAKRRDDTRARKMKVSFRPKRHRVASLNALAKVHCLYENETRGAIFDGELLKTESNSSTASSNSSNYYSQPVKQEDDDDDPPPTRKLRSVPGLRAIGKHWERDESSSSEEESFLSPVCKKEPPAESTAVQKEAEKRSAAKKRRNRTELIMDLKDMVVRKRMASLNASAILAASYSLEKRSIKSPKCSSDESSDTLDESDSSASSASERKRTKKGFEDGVRKEEEAERKVIEVRATPNKKVSVILNQDTDVTITGVYVNSTTRSTHHEGYCSIAGMQYRISATSHTQTAATAVATETILQPHGGGGTDAAVEEPSSASRKSYTPLSALSSMQPPGTPGAQHPLPAQPQHVVPLGPPPQHPSPIGRRHGCPSAFSAPGPYGPPPGHHLHAPPHPDPTYIQGYYQPAGPLINHGHIPSSLGKPTPLSETSSSPTPPPAHQPHPSHPPPPPSTVGGESSDSDVIITSSTSGKELPPVAQPPPAAAPPLSYRYGGQYPTTPPTYPYAYPPQYYPPHAPPSYAPDLCYPPGPYLHPKAYPPVFRRYLSPGTQYYPASPAELYHPAAGNPVVSQQSQQVVAATPTSRTSSYPPTSAGPPPPPSLVDSYAPAPPPGLVEHYSPHYYSSYGPPPPPPSCYSHSPARSLPYLNATYQNCPCPMESCPKNVHTGPLTGDSKRSVMSTISKNSLPLPPVALALPLEPVSATGPPSPARGSAGMPPPPSPAGATYQPPPQTPKQEASRSPETVNFTMGHFDSQTTEKRKARIGKNMVRNNIAAKFPEHTMLLMCQTNAQNINVKREIESPEEEKLCVELKSKVELKEAGEKLMEKSAADMTKTEPTNVISLKVEEKTQPSPETKCIPEKPEDLLPCLKTVAENVKVKNMKRKLSAATTDDPITVDPKKIKTEKLKANGSYKDLIKKDVPSVRINNGKRKLIGSERAMARTKSLTKTKKVCAKRKLSTQQQNKEEPAKRAKLSKPLAASSLHNSKQNANGAKAKPVIGCDLAENKDPKPRTLKGSGKVTNGKKSAPALLDNLLAKNSVDRTIDRVVAKCAGEKRTKAAKATKETQSKSTNLKGPKQPCKKVAGAAKRKSRSKSLETSIVTTFSKLPRRQLLVPRWSNGWSWKGEPYQSKVFLNNEEQQVTRICYPAMRHMEGDIIEPRDCVLLKAGPRKNDLPFVAKVAALWENPEDGEMMMSLLWYYRPEHTDHGRQPFDEPDEVFASRHKDTNSVACIEDKCYVLTFNEYCRYRKALRRLEAGLEHTKTTIIPSSEVYPRAHRQPPSTMLTPSELIFFCRRVYDFRQKRIVKNPS